MFEKVVVVDCSNHMLGRLASVVAKEIMNGQKVVCVRTEEISVSGSLFRNKLIFAKFLQHRGSTKPSRGPLHYRSPARMLWRTVRGMMNHFKQRGQAAMGRLKVFEGIPHPFDKVKRKVIPQALRVLRLKPGRKWCRLGDLSSQVGWTHNDLITRLEAKRKVRSAAAYALKKRVVGLRAKAAATIDAKAGVVAVKRQKIVIPKPTRKSDRKVESKEEKKPKKDDKKGDKKDHGGDKKDHGGDKKPKKDGDKKDGDKKDGDKKAKGGDKKDGDKKDGDKKPKDTDKAPKDTDKAPKDGGDKKPKDGDKKPKDGGDKKAKGGDKKKKGDE